MLQPKKFKIGGVHVPRGVTRDIEIPISETYSGMSVKLHVRVIRARKRGPCVFLTGAIHGDELNGMGVIRDVMFQKQKLIKGTLICVPLVNVFGFENHSRYLPDRRDLNRCFPGSKKGSLAFRLAHILTHEIVKKSDYGIDLHAAAVRRTNYPQIRADLSVPGAKELARAFGCEIIINNKGDENSLRSTATQLGCPTILYEAGEVFKFEPGAIAIGVRGATNVLKHLGMLKGSIKTPAFQVFVNTSYWIRSNTGGILSYSVRPGDIVERGAKIGFIAKTFTNETDPLYAPVEGIIIGISTLPAVKPGEPVCHVAVPNIKMSEILKKLKMRSGTLHKKVQKELSSSIQLYSGIIDDV